MTIGVDTAWEIRTTGAGTNGGGFKDLNPGTSIDYSQQDAAQLALTDITSNGAGIGISSTTGGFTAAMHGNCIFITGGTGFTTGWYQITTYTDTNNITIDRSCGVSKTGGTGNVGGAWKFNPTNNGIFFNTTNKSTYNICWIKAGTYTSTDLGIISIGISPSHHWWKGYNAVRGDTPIGNNRPLLDWNTFSGYMSWSGAHGACWNLRINSAYAGGQNLVYMTSVFPVLFNCKITRSGFASIAVRMLGDWSRIIQCEVFSTLNNAIQIEKENGLVTFSYIHDSVNGVMYSGIGSGLAVEHCIIDSCSGKGLQFTFGSRAVNNIIYNCGHGIVTASVYQTYLNNIIHSCGTGINGANQETISDYNCFYNNTTDRSGGVMIGDNDISSNPFLTDPANADFSLGAGSPCFDTAAKLGVAVGLP